MFRDYRKEAVCSTWNMAELSPLPPEAGDRYPQIGAAEVVRRQVLHTARPSIFAAKPHRYKLEAIAGFEPPCNSACAPQFHHHSSTVLSIGQSVISPAEEGVRKELAVLRQDVQAAAGSVRQASESKVKTRSK